MTAPCPISQSVPFPKQFGRIFALLIVLGSLVLAGCDFVDSNAVMDEPQIDETRHISMPPERAQFHVADSPAPTGSTPRWINMNDKPEMMPLLHEYAGSLGKNGFAGKETPEIIGPPDFVPTWFDLVGVWRVAGKGQFQGATLTFTLDQRVRLATVCKTYEGPFSSESQGQLTIAHLQLMQKTCGPMADDPMVWALMAATSYKIQGGVLCITGARGDLFFTPTGA